MTRATSWPWRRLWLRHLLQTSRALERSGSCRLSKPAPPVQNWTTDFTETATEVHGDFGWRRDLEFETSKELLSFPCGSVLSVNSVVKQALAAR